MTDKLALTTNARSYQALKGLHHGAHREHGVFATKAQRHKGPHDIYSRARREHGDDLVAYQSQTSKINPENFLQSVLRVFSVYDEILYDNLSVSWCLCGGGLK